MLTKYMDENRRRVAHDLWLMLCFCVLSVSGPAAPAQVDQGTILGTVQDNTGAVIPGAAVTLTNTDTDLTLTGHTNGSGIYVFSPLKIGN
jgi:hypothetical protein